MFIVEHMKHRQSSLGHVRVAPQSADQTSAIAFGVTRSQIKSIAFA